MVKKFSKIGVCMVFVLSMILPQAAVSKAKTANPYTGKKYVYCSNYKDGIELYGKDGSKKKKYTLIKKEYSMREIYKTKSYIYYYKVNRKDSSTGYVWQVPLNQKTGKLKVKKKKKLFYVNEWREFLYATDKKIVYRINNSIVSYNKKTKQKTSLTGKPVYYSSINVAKDASGLTAKIGNCIYYSRFKSYYKKIDEAFYQLNLSTGKRKKIVNKASQYESKRYRYDEHEKLDTQVGISGKKLYVPTEKWIICYDMAKKKKTNLISMDVLMQCVKEKFSTDAFHSMHIDKFYFIGNTMYLQLAVDYQYKIGAYQEISYDRNYVVVSLNKKTGKSITYEEELSSFLKNYGNGYNDGNQCGMHNWTVRTGMILDVTQNGTWIGEFVNEKGELFYYSYNKNTKVTKLYSSKKAKVRLMQQGLMMKRMCDLYADGNLRFIVTIVRCRFLCITENKKSANEHLTQTNSTTSDIEYIYKR